MNLELVRFGHNDAVIGVLRNATRTLAITLERPWHDNLPDISCIPAGLYTCKRVKSPKFGNTFEVMNVFGRVDILFHKGNTVEDTQGCILLGKTLDMSGITPGIAMSKVAFDEFIDMLQAVGEFDLLIKEA